MSRSKKKRKQLQKIQAGLQAARIPSAVPKSLDVKRPTWTRSPPTTVRFSPTAWAKLLYLRDLGKAEVGGFGVAPADDLLYIEDVVLVKQSVSGASVEFDDEAVADFFDAQVDAGRKPGQFARIWLHTHPAMSATPSGVDEATFMRVFGKSDWAVMVVVSTTEETYARVQFNVGPKGHIEVPVQVDYSRPFAGSDVDAWKAEYEANVSVELLFNYAAASRGNARLPGIPARTVPWFDEDREEKEREWEFYERKLAHENQQLGGHDPWEQYNRTGRFGDVADERDYAFGADEESERET